MQHLLYLILLALAITVGVWAWLKQRRTATVFSQELDAIEVEERRLFGFLHGLAEKLQEDLTRANLHRYIVDGVAEVVGAKAGILYLLDPTTDRLVPVYQSPETAAVLPFPLGIVPTPEASVESQYHSYVRLTYLHPGEGFIGHVYTDGCCVQVDDAASHPDFAGEGDLSFQTSTRILAAPLFHARKPIGVLAVTRQGTPTFNQSEREMFDSLISQSAFALASAAIHTEVMEKRRYERELKQASEIQRILLPRSAPALADYELAADYLPARHVSGDYYDYVPVDDTHVGVAIGDVCGKGIAASLIMAMCRANLRSRAPEILSPASVLHSVNHSIFPDIREDMFVSLLYLILERGSSEIIFARAGHEPPLLYKAATGETEVVESPGLAAGVDEGPVFQRSVRDCRLRLEAGDTLLLYTDGVVERENKEGDEYGIERLRQILSTLCQRPAKEVIDAITADLSEFSEGKEQGDDITLIAITKR